MKFEVSILIDRPIEDVFNYVADGQNGAEWNSAVKKVKKFSEGSVGLHTKYWMLRELPTGPTENIYEVIEYEPKKQLTITTINGPTPFTYHYSFEPDENCNCTKLSLKAELDNKGLNDTFGVKARILPVAFLSRFVQRGVKKNFRTLKELLETKT